MAPYCGYTTEKSVHICQHKQEINCEYVQQKHTNTYAYELEYVHKARKWKVHAARSAMRDSVRVLLEVEEFMIRVKSDLRKRRDLR